MSKVHFVESNSAQSAEEAPEKELSIQEEYQLWRKNCPYMYDFVSETALTWPSLTIQWLPTTIPSNPVNGFKQKLLLGTNTSGNDTDYLKIAETVLPSQLVTGKRAEDTTAQAKNARLRVIKKFKNPSEVNRARYDPFNSKRVATINGTGDVHLYDVDDKNAEPVVLIHHSENGYGLAWNTLLRDRLLTASDDKTVALWDVNAPAMPLNVYEDHTDIVNEVQWHKKNQHLFSSVSDDQTFKLYDIREHTKIHDVTRKSAINTVAFSSFSSNLYALGLANSTIEIFDLRNPSTPLHTIMGHSDSITCLEWCPHVDSLLASGSSDRRVILWDISKIGMEQVQEDEDDGAAELFMMHAGHTSAITDLSWNPEVKFLVGSVAEDNIVHLWRVNERLMGEVEGWVDDELEGYEGLE